MKNEMLIPVILSGGAGTRLWPVSRRALPKPFMRLADGETLAAKTLHRALAVADPAAPILTITGQDYYYLTRHAYHEVLDEAARRRAMYLLEPVGRNTAPAVAAAALWAATHYGPDSTLLILPADHLVRDRDAFTAAVATARRAAAAGWLVTFGITPTEPDSGFGYIEAGDKLGDGIYRAASFIEKPDPATAQRLLAAGGYSWNSGMFLFRTGEVLAALAEYAPEVHDAMREVWAASDTAANPLELDEAQFAAVPDISFDYAVMERAGRVAVVPAALGWSDIGSWRALSELYDSDEYGNRRRGKALLIDSRNCFVQGEERLVAALGVDDLVIVDTADAVLVAARDRVQEVRQIVARLTAEEHEAAVFHRTVERPWGSFTVLEDAADCKVKRLIVRPGGVLSLQRHQRRSEHWTVIRGQAKVRLGDDEQRLGPNETLAIPVNTLHRLENPGTDDLHLIEVQTGDYFGEDDIERLEDIYGRLRRQA